ncbi:MAG: outer membrane protein transport protein [Kofleriaceae bacterium]|nr:outer membrane protein transport protein [Kofleriaceae bacterium]
MTNAGLGCAALLFSWEANAYAGGIFVPGAGPAAQGRAGAFVARADDPSAISYNPAGFAKLDGTQIYVGANFLRYVMSYQRTGVYEPTAGSDAPLPHEGQPFPKVSNNGDSAIGPFGAQIIPVFAISTDLGHPEWPVRFGFGLFSPQGFPDRDFGSTVTLDSGITAPAPQRYDVVNQKIIVSSPSLIVGYSPFDSLDVGIRASWGYAKLNGAKTIWGERNYEEDPGDDATFTLTDAVDKFVPSMGLGLLYRPSPSWEIGAVWNSKGEIRAQGTGNSVVGGGSTLGDIMIVPRPDDQVECDTGGVVGKLQACLSLDMAQNATIGGRWIYRDGAGRERADIELDVNWEDWSASTTSRVQVDGMVDANNMRLRNLANHHGFKGVISTRLGGGYRMDMGDGEIEFKGGVAYDTKTAPDTWTRVDQDNKQRLTLTTGLSYSFGRYRFDIGVGIVLEPDITVADDCPGPDGFGPTVSEQGCNGDTPVDERNRPSPGQPLFGEKSQFETPFNAGLYESGYLMFATGLKIAL